MKTNKKFFLVWIISVIPISGILFLMSFLMARIENHGLFANTFFADHFVGISYFVTLLVSFVIPSFFVNKYIPKKEIEDHMKMDEFVIKRNSNILSFIGGASLTLIPIFGFIDLVKPDIFDNVGFFILYGILLFIFFGISYFYSKHPEKIN
ncbi:hypothetical protein KGV55_01895 [Candidatus Gracilibacteria bacterium]|nr:hypothetical protein [Candidatus Gracilibacteria bacterium]